MNDPAYRKRARALFASEGKLEIDPLARVSRGPSRGAYVAAWVWVPDDSLSYATGASNTDKDRPQLEAA